MEKLKDYVVIDTETTGLSPKRCKVIEVCASRVRNNQIVETFTTLLNPGCQLPYFIPQITGITDKMLVGKPKFYEIADTLKEFIGRDIIVGHNIIFDIKFLNAELNEELSNETVDTMWIARKLCPGLKCYKLESLCKLFSLIDKQLHRAESDVYITYRLYEHLMSE